MGAVVPDFAIGGRTWGEYVSGRTGFAERRELPTEFASGGSPNPDLQRHLLDTRIEYGLSLASVRVPRDHRDNVRADCPRFRTCAQTICPALLRHPPSTAAWLGACGRSGPPRGAYLDGLPVWCPHSIDRVHLG